MFLGLSLYPFWAGVYFFFVVVPGFIVIIYTGLKCEEEEKQKLK